MICINKFRIWVMTVFRLRTGNLPSAKGTALRLRSGTGVVFLFGFGCALPSFDLIVSLRKNFFD
jgi:hypothetical protein